MGIFQIIFYSIGEQSQSEKAGWSRKSRFEYDFILWNLSFLQSRGAFYPLENHKTKLWEI